MTSGAIGTEGYAEEAPALLIRYERAAFATVHAPILHLLPHPPFRALDIGAGTGRDAAGLAELGAQVLAVEPTDELREPARALHPSPRIDWLKDRLPDLAATRARGETFDLVLLTAVWMHLDLAQRDTAFPHVAGLIAAGGLLALTQRHGPVPEGRRMFDVLGDETRARAKACGLTCVLEVHEGSMQEPNRSAGVTWTRLAFRKPR